MRHEYRLLAIPTVLEVVDPFWQTLRDKSPPPGDALSRLLREGPIVAHEVVPWGSNYTFLAALADDTGKPQALAIYKPAQGEAPLWDFPEGNLHFREYAAYLASERLGLGLVPETVLRDGPFGLGTAQRYVDPVERSHYFSLRESHCDDLRRLALFDLLINNADRKAGHMFLGRDGRVYGIDHGLTFNVAPKLRTVIWDFIGQPLPAPLVALLEERFGTDTARAELATALAPYLNALEIQRFFTRAERLLERRVFPPPRAGRDHNVPWSIL